MSVWEIRKCAMCSQDMVLSNYDMLMEKSDPKWAHLCDDCVTEMVNDREAGER